MSKLSSSAFFSSFLHAAGSVRTESVAPNRLVLLVAIVPKGKGTFFSDFLQQNYGANLQLAIVGTGTARSDLVEFFGLKDNKRSVIFSVVLQNRVNDILGALEDRFRTVNGETEYFGRYNFTAFVDNTGNLKLKVGWNNRDNDAEYFAGECCGGNKYGKKV